MTLSAALKPAVTADTVRQDGLNTLAFLQAMVVAVPGADSLSLADVMAYLEQIGNPLTLELLTRAMIEVSVVMTEERAKRA